MPIYEYVCRACGNRFEQLQRSLRAAAPDCPECGAGQPVKQFSTFSATVRETPAQRCSLGPCAGGGCDAGRGCMREG